MDFIDQCKKRGYFYQCTNEDSLRNISNTQNIAAYVGFDCTAKSLHIGNLMQIMILRLLQQCGHKPIIIIGGTTTKIGDPTGKDVTRKVLSHEEINVNILGIKKSLSKFITFGNGSSDAVILNNADWLESLGYIEFLRDMGHMFSINRMLTMDSVRLRLEREQSLTFLEFNYMLLQAYDFYHLNQKFDCILQIGGSDQWGNIVTGTDLIRKSTGREAFGLTTPLLTTASGNKMGKSVNGAIWINEEELTPYDYYQYWRNIEDADVMKFATLYYEFSDQELIEFRNLAKHHINDAKKRLAYLITSLCHGKIQADMALETATKVFEQGDVGTALPTLCVTEKQMQEGINCYDLFFQSKLAKSKSDARRLIKGNGAKINGTNVEDSNMIIDMSFVQNNIIKLTAGKKHHALVKIQPTEIKIN